MPGSHWDWVSCGPKNGPPGSSWTWNIMKYKLSIQIKDPGPGFLTPKTARNHCFWRCLYHPQFGSTHPCHPKVILYTSDCNGNAQMWHSWWWIGGLKISQNDPTTFHVNVTCNCMTWACFWFFFWSSCWHSLAAWLEHRRSVISRGCRPIFLTWFVAI